MRSYTGESVIVLDSNLDYSRRRCASLTLVIDPKVQWMPPDSEESICHFRGLDRDLTEEWGDYPRFG